jgi:hypothetical protein
VRTPGAAAQTSRAISVSRNDFDISLEQVCSLREEQLISRIRSGPSSSSCRACAAWIAARAAIQSSARS